MADSELRKITDALVVESQKVVNIGRTGKVLLNWHEVEDLPAAMLGVAQEDKGGGPTRSKEATATFFFYTITGGDSPLDAFLALYQALEQEIDDDPTLGGLALTAEVVGMRSLTTSETISNGRHVADVLVDVTYRHGRGTP